MDIRIKNVFLGTHRFITSDNPTLSTYDEPVECSCENKNSLYKVRDVNS